LCLLTLRPTLTRALPLPSALLLLRLRLRGTA
jgi:hypothetical protein